MNSFKGTRRLIRLILRIDRTKLPIWIILTVGLVALTIPQLTQAYGSLQQRQLYAGATAPSVVSRLLGGALTGPSMGEIVVVETAFLAFLMLALLNIFLVIRHTRKNEESGRSELIGSMVVGRQAMLSAVLVVALVVNTICAVLLYISMTANGLPANGSAIFSIGLAASGLFFAVVAAVCAQLFQSARAANSAAAGIFGAAFLIRGVGDALGNLVPGGLGVQTSWISYLSPLGWVTGAKPFGNEQSVWILLFIPFIAVGVAAAYYLLVRRDNGAGVFAPRLGKAEASVGLLKPFGLLWRLNRTSFISWLAAMSIFGATVGAVAKEFEKLVAGNEEMQKLLKDLGGDGEVSDIMFSATFNIAAIAIAAYMVQLLIRMHTEESSGRLGLVLSTSQNRLRWLAKNSLFAFVTGSIILATTGLVSGAVFGMVSDQPVIASMTNLAGAILVQLPAILVLSSAAVSAFAILPSKFVPLSWTLLAGSLLIVQLGAILKLPSWAINFSPFTHTPPAPADTISLVPLLYLTGVFVSLFSLAIYRFHRRDLLTG